MNLRLGDCLTVEMRAVVFLRLGLLLVLATSTIEARADLSGSQARRLITRIAGIELPSSAVRVKSVSSSSNSSAEAIAEIKAVFRLATNEHGDWRAVEVRVGPDRWEELAPIVTNRTVTSSLSCDGPDLRHGRPANEPTTQRARCLIAAVLGVQLPSDAVRIKGVSPLALPLASHPSAVVESLITIELRFAREKRGWMVAAVRSGNHDWISPQILVAAANEAKSKRAREEMNSIAEALLRFRTERRSYVDSDSHAVLIDYLSPRFLSRVIRLDPWHEPYQYWGARDNFTLRSLGPDRKENTADDITITQSADNSHPTS